MSTGSIRLITTQKVLKTWNVKGVNQHYLDGNHHTVGAVLEQKGTKYFIPSIMPVAL